MDDIKRVAVICFMALTSCKTMKQSPQITERWPEKPQPPVAEKIAKALTIHNDVRVDNYYWLNEKENPNTIAYLEAENAYLDKMMSHTKSFQEKLFGEMKSRIKEKDESVPVFKNGYFYYTRFEEGKQYYKYCFSLLL